MSDEENTAVQADETAQEQVTEITAESGEQAENGEAATPSGDNATASKPKKKGVQERIDELTRQRHDRERELEAARQEADYWKAQVIQKPKVEAQAPTGKPTVEQYESYEDYLEALSDYKVSEKLQATQQQMATANQQAQLAERQKAFHAKAEKLDIPDFVDVVYNPDLLLSQDMVDIAFDSEKGPEILYYLGKNPAEAARIAQMDKARAGYEIGRLEAALQLPPAKNVTSAPPPIKPISGGGEPPQMDQEKMTPEQWRDWRNEQLRMKGAR